MISVPSWARRGQRVICITDDWHREADCPHVSPPIKGSIYTIAGVHRVRLLGKVVLELAELPLGICADVRGFRPAVSLDEDMAAHFTQLLHHTDYHPEPV